MDDRLLNVVLMKRTFTLLNVNSDVLGISASITASLPIMSTLIIFEEEYVRPTLSDPLNKPLRTIVPFPFKTENAFLIDLNGFSPDPSPFSSSPTVALTYTISVTLNAEVKVSEMVL